MKKILLLIALIVCTPQINAQFASGDDYKGDTGPRGDKGLIGDTGRKGKIGLRGYTGPGWDPFPHYKHKTGKLHFTDFTDHNVSFSTGDLRAQGKRGLRGEKGDIGAMGPQGSRGARALPVSEGRFYPQHWEFEIVGNDTLGIATTENVGIGTSKFLCDDYSRYPLFVKGGVRTEKVKVGFLNEDDWADKVFKKDYELMSLDSLDAFIKKNRHLPGVPTAKEVVEGGGIELKQMNVLLLKKIEELSLYLIELDKKTRSN